MFNELVNAHIDRKDEITWVRQKDFEDHPTTTLK